MAGMGDPYYLVREEIQESVTKLHASYARWDSHPPGSQMRAGVAKELVEECESVLWQLGELDRATGLAEQDYARFKIEKAELASRRNWNSSTRTQVESVKATCSEALKAQAAASSKPGAKSAASKLGNAIADENETYLNNAAEQHQEVIRRQDENLDGLSAGLSRLKVMAGTISDELDDQSKMLDQLEEGVDDTSNRLSAAQRKLAQVIKKSGMRGQIAIIVCLCVTLVILLVIAVN